MNPDQTINLNQNAADCIKSASSFGETVYTNICNGSVSHVAWGSVDAVLCLLGLAVVAAFVLVFISLAIAVMRA